MGKVKVDDKLFDASCLMQSDLMPWIEMFFMLSSEIFKRDPLGLLDRAGADENDYEIFMRLRAVYNKWQEDEMKAKSGSR